MSDSLKWFGFWVFLAVLAVGVTQCATEMEKHTYNPTQFDKCIFKCPMNSWGTTFIDDNCPRMCAELVKDINCYNTS